MSNFPAIVRRNLRAGFWVLALAGAVGCDNLLEQEAPGSIRAEDLDASSAAPLLVNSAIGSFECAQTQVNMFTGLVSDELIDAQLLLGGWDIDRRTLTSASEVGATCASAQVPGFYTPVSIARFQADDAIRRLEAFTDAEVPNRARLIGRAAAYAGYSLLLLGEGACSAAIDVGPELTPAMLFAQAENRFTKAIDQSAVGTEPATTNLARLGRARVRLNLGKNADARADAALIPVGFTASTTHSTTIVARQNRIWDAFFRGFFVTVDPSFRNVTFGGVPDLRIGRVTDAGRNGQDNSTRIWRTDKYPVANTPSPIAKYTEAQLLIAEIDGGQSAVNIINALHTAAGLPAFASSDPAAIKAQVLQERSRELYLEGHRLWDMIRFSLPLTPPAGTPFPKGGTYGTQLCLPLPDIEKNNNPNFQ